LYAVPAVTPEEGEISRREDPGAAGDLRAVADEIRRARPEWSRRSVLRALEGAIADGRPRELAVAAMRAVAADPETRHPGRLRHDGDWWVRAEVPARAARRPEWCGACDERTRLLEIPDPADPEARTDRIVPCPACHPRALEAS